jgi:hypothetical protein
MCQYINVVLPKDTMVAKSKPLFEKHGLGYHPFQNSFVLGQFKKDVQLINTTSKQCDCGSVIGSDANHSGKSIQPKDIERLKHKGWSETKIKNWIANKTKTDTHAKEHETERNQWISFLREVIWENNIGMVGLYIHWYDNDISDEKITFRNKEKISLSELQGDALDKLNYDILYEFTS